MSRKPISTRTRFEVFKRDGFRCAYCGRGPLESKLHVDHVEPVKSGGSSDPSNLITACADCNMGKSSVPLTKSRLKPNETVEDIQERTEQIREYLKYQRLLQGMEEEAVNVVAEYWEDVIGPLTEGMYACLRKRVKEWSMSRLREAIDITGARLGCPGEEFEAWRAIQQARYFHGILRRWRQEGIEGGQAKG